MSRKRALLYTKGLLAALEQNPGKTDELLDAFMKILEENRQLRYSQTILQALEDLVEERGETVRVRAQSAFPLSDQSINAIERFFQKLPHTKPTETVAADTPGIHLMTAREHWDGRVSTMLTQLSLHLNH